MDYLQRQLSARYPTDLKAWQALKTHHRDTMRTKTLRELFARDQERAEKFTLVAGDPHLARVDDDDAVTDLQATADNAVSSLRSGRLMTAVPHF